MDGKQAGRDRDRDIVILYFVFIRSNGHMFFLFLMNAILYSVFEEILLRE